VKVNGTELYVEERGDGIPLIAIHGGLGFDHGYLKQMLGPLEGTFRVIYFDQRGNGRSQRVPLETITIRQLADDVDALREALGLERVAVLGHSYGGFVALQYATKHPERISHLICVDTSPGAFEPTPDEFAERPDPSWITPEVEAAMAVYSAGPPTTDEDFVAILPKVVAVYLYKTPAAELAGVLGKAVVSADAMIRGFEALEGWSVASELGRIACPTLVLCGRYDLQCTPECAKRLSTAIPDADLVWFEESGHFPWIEEPGAFEAAIRGWLRTVPDRSAGRS